VQFDESLKPVVDAGPRPGPDRGREPR